MRELFGDKNKIQNEIKASQDQKKTIKMIGSQRKIKGHTLFEYNTKTGELTKAKYKVDDTIEINSLSSNPKESVKRRKVIINEHCIYFQALNMANAIRHLNK